MWRACICASARWRAAACAGPTGATTSAPRCWAWCKAQQVKNAVIVPVGSKGGFYPKQLPRGGRPTRCGPRPCAAYRTFLCGLLDLTDNLVADGKVIPPEGVVGYDGDDPYLVVAADKGTATFSDIANGDGRGLRLLAGRRLRLGRLGRLRPQGHGHHRPRRLGGGEAPLPRAGQGHPDAAVHA